MGFGVWGLGFEVWSLGFSTSVEGIAHVFHEEGTAHLDCKGVLVDGGGGIKRFLWFFLIDVSGLKNFALAAECTCNFHLFEEVLGRGAQHDKTAAAAAAAAAHIPHPTIGLPLRVYHQRPLPTQRHNHCTVYAHRVTWQPSQVPPSDAHGAASG